MRSATKEKGIRAFAPTGPRGANESEGGFALIFVIFTIMVVGILGALVLLYTAYALRTAVGVSPSSRAQTTAEAGLDTAHAMLASGEIAETTSIPIAGTMFDGDGDYSVTVVKNPNLGDGDPYDWLVTSSGEYTTEVEGVERTFYRQLEEVITFAGGRYYSALDFVIFSKEGNIDLNLGGNLASVGGILIDGSMYAGNNIELANSASLAAGKTFDMKGDVVTEHGDVTMRQLSVALSASDMKLLGSVYSGILTNSGDLGGGILLESRLGFFNGAANISITGEVNSRGRLRDYDNGVRLYNWIGIAGSCTNHISGTIKSNRDVYGENAVFAIGTANNRVDGTIYCGEDVNFSSTLGIGGALNNNINGSIYAAGNVNLYGNAVVLGTMQNRVGGDIQAGGVVDIYHHFFIGCGNPSGYVVGGNIYGDSVKLDSRLGAFGTLANSVGGNIYSSGSLDLDNYGGAGASRVNISGSVYATGNMDIYTKGVLGTGTVTVSGAVSPLNPPSLQPGVYSNGTMVMSASDGWFDTTNISINRDARRYGGSPSLTGDVDIAGSTAALPGTFNVPAPTEPTPPTEYNEVVLPECDFDYYRELAKGQEIEDGLDHYFSASPEPNLDIPAGAYSSSLFAVFVEGDLDVGEVAIPVNCKAVLVATGDITLQESVRTEGSGDSEFQVIAGGRFLYDASGNLTINDNDQFFIYAAHEDYDPVSEPVSVEYEMGWFKNLNGQITARGDIVLNSDGSRFSWLPGSQYSIHYKSPSVLGEAFRIPFKVKSWKEL